MLFIQVISPSCCLVWMLAKKQNTTSTLAWLFYFMLYDPFFNSSCQRSWIYSCTLETNLYFHKMSIFIIVIHFYHAVHVLCSSHIFFLTFNCFFSIWFIPFCSVWLPLCRSFSHLYQSICQRLRSHHHPALFFQALSDVLLCCYHRDV